MNSVLRWSTTLATLTALLTPSFAEAAPERTVSWREDWPKFKAGEYLLTGSLLLGTGAIILFVPKDKEPNWRGPILFDEATRDATRATTPDGRKTAAAVGDWFYYGGLAYPYLVDVVAVAWIGHRAPEVAAQMALINTEAFAIAGFLSFVSNAVIRRERPYARECVAGKPDYKFPSCTAGGDSEGFFSGHTAIAVTGAALSCMHHANLPLYGKSGVGGTVACIAMLAGATVGGYLRLPADKHYVTDVIAGAAIGLASGLIVPWLHYRNGSRRSTQAIRILPAPMVSATTAGLGAIMLF